MDWSFLNKYKHREIENGFRLLELTPVETFPEIFICVDKKGDTIIIFDGGSTMGVLEMIYNFSSKEITNKFIKICEMNKISSKDEVLFLHCTKENFDDRLQDFINALNQICKM